MKRRARGATNGACSVSSDTADFHESVRVHAGSLCLSVLLYLFASNACCSSARSSVRDVCCAVCWSVPDVHATARRQNCNACWCVAAVTHGCCICMILAPRIAKAGVNGTPPHVRGRLTAIHPSSSPMGLSTTERFCSTLPVSSGDVCIASALSARTMHAAEASAATCVVCGVGALSLGRSFPPGALGSGCMRDGDALMVDGGTGASGALPLPCAPCRAMS